MPDSCTNGMPEYLGFEKVGFAPGSATVSYTDKEMEKDWIKVFSIATG